MKLTKNIILNEVNTLVHVSGFNSATFSNIAKVLSTTRENIHHHFKTKNKLGVLYIEYLYDFLTNYFYEINNSNLNFNEKLDNYFLLYTRHSKIYASCPLVSLMADFKLLNEDMQIKLQNLLELEFTSLTSILKNEYPDNDDSSLIANNIIILLKGSVLYEKASFIKFEESVNYIKKLYYNNLESHLQED